MDFSAYVMHNCYAFDARLPAYEGIGWGGIRTPGSLGHCPHPSNKVLTREIATCTDLCGLRRTFLLLFLCGQPY